MNESERILKVIAVFLGLIVTAIIVVALKVLKSIMLPLLVAWLLSFVLGPFVELLMRRKIPLWLAIIIMVTSVFLFVYLVGLLIYSSSSSFMDEFPKYEERITILAQDILTHFDIPLPQAKEYISTLNWEEALQKYKIPQLVSSTLGSFFSFLGNLIMVILLMLFIIPGRIKIGNRLQRTFKEDTAKAEKFQLVLNTINSRVQLYLLAKTAVSLTTGVIASIILLAFGVDFAIMWGLFIFLLDYIPNIGSVIAIIPPILVCFIQYGFDFHFIIVAIMLIMLQMVMGNVVEPRVVGKHLNLSPLVVIISLVFWGWLWGIPGMVLAIPLVSSLKIVCENISPLKPIAAIIEGD